MVVVVSPLPQENIKNVKELSNVFFVNSAGKGWKGWTYTSVLRRYFYSYEIDFSQTLPMNFQNIPHPPLKSALSLSG